MVDLGPASSLFGRIVVVKLSCVYTPNSQQLSMIALKHAEATHELRPLHSTYVMILVARASNVGCGHNRKSVGDT